LIKSAAGVTGSSSRKEEQAMRKLRRGKISAGICLLAAATMMSMTFTACGNSASEKTESSVVDTENVTAKITLSDDGSTIEGKGAEVSDENDKVKITAGGTYEVTGTLSDGRLVVDAEGEDVTIILNGVTITDTEEGAIFAKNANSVIVYVMEDTTNTLTSGTEDMLTAAEAVATAVGAAEVAELVPVAGAAGA